MIQHELALVRSASKASIPFEFVTAKKTAAQAFTLACDVSGLEDKEIYGVLEIDSGTFSRIKKGLANFPDDKLKLFCNTVGNTIYADWIAYQLNCVLVVIKTEAERRADEEREARIKAETKVRFYEEIFSGMSLGKTVLPP